MTGMKYSLDITAMTTEIVAGYVSRNHMEQQKLTEFTQQIYHSLESLSLGHSFKFLSPTAPVVPIEAIKPDYLICLEDGLQFKMLKRPH